MCWRYLYKLQHCNKKTIPVRNWKGLIKKKNILKKWKYYSCKTQFTFNFSELATQSIDHVVRRTTHVAWKSDESKVELRMKMLKKTLNRMKFKRKEQVTANEKFIRENLKQKQKKQTNWKHIYINWKSM